ncbi:NifB/NifX family molybdenum-iron cluster-binding protein [Anaerophilus nitritogenes]|uniref:NifB/NifX family molybdenum-iron cluster-binding protein n=1 Tax=Anaerophilus nitritogenes TaxID=2498136 RepID=UPI00101BCA22|nr:NifB/NifX family molybdenum-iron cluster-binding protein [Anaerophilus nitritogenes]
MKIALPTRAGQIDSHFGHCEYYTIVEINDKKEIVSKETLESPEGCGCKSNIAYTLSEIGVEWMLAGNMGQGAVNVLASQNIKVVRGCSGDVDTVVKNWLEGKVQDNLMTCDHHDCNH